MSVQQHFLNEFRKIKSELRDLKSQVDFFETKYTEHKHKNESILLRLKNKEIIPNHFINGPLSYLDMSPEQAYDYYCDENKDFLIIDVSLFSGKDLNLCVPEAQTYTLEELDLELTSINRPILVISEDGVRSILACNILCRLGFLHVNNVSGGLKFWPGFRQSQLKAS